MNTWSQCWALALQGSSRTRPSCSRLHYSALNWRSRSSMWRSTKGKSTSSDWSARTVQSICSNVPLRSPFSPGALDCISTRNSLLLNSSSGLLTIIYSTCSSSPLSHNPLRPPLFKQVSLLTNCLQSFYSLSSGIKVKFVFNFNLIWIAGSLSRAGVGRPGQGLTMISEMGSSGEDLGIYANITVNKSTSLPRTAIQKSASSASSRTPSFASSSGAPPVPAHGVERGERAAPKPRFPTFTGSL